MTDASGQRQRAEADDLYNHLISPMWKGTAPDAARERIFLALQHARQEALLEAVSKIRSRGDEYMRDCKAKDASGKKYRDTYEMRRVNSGRAWAFKDLADELDRLAREGVKS